MKENLQSACPSWLPGGRRIFRPVFRADYSVLSTDVWYMVKQRLPRN